MTPSDADAAPSDDAAASRARAGADDGRTPPPDDSAPAALDGVGGTAALSADAPAHDAPAHDGPAHDAPAHDAPAHDAPAHDGPDTAVIGWVSRPPRRRRVAGWALTLAIVALVASLFGAWGLPVGVAAVIVALQAVRRRTARTVAVWALALAVLSVLYGAGWLIWMLGQR